MKKLLLSLFALIALAVPQQSEAQHRNCGSNDHHQHLMQTNPDYAATRNLIEMQTANYVNNPNAHSRAVVTIPVVFHVVYKTAAQNVSDAQIMSQLTVLNNDFRKLNADWTNTPAAFQSLVADCEIQFCLAQQDPNGNPTTGINRVSTTVTSFGTNDAVKYAAQGGANIWDRNKYLNIWVCNLSGGVLGYAQFPGGPAATDGVVITYTGFGTTGTASAPFNKGRTATHEVGHWLNLYHIWGDDGTGCNGSDQVGDTPNAGGENYGCPTFPKVSCSNGPNGDLFMNYMDYTDDACMYMFTTGQKTRMSALFAAGGARVSLLTSPGCNAPNPVACGTPSGLNATGISSTSATLNWTAVPTASSYNINYRLSGAATWTSTTSSTTSKVLTGLTASSTYEYQVQAICTGGAGSFSANATFTTPSAATCGTPTGLNATSITTTTATLNWAAVAGATSYNVQYKLTAAATWTSTTSSTNSKAITGLSAGSGYQFQVQAVCPSGTGSFSSLGSFTTTIVAATCTNTYESNNTLNTAASIAVNTTISSMIGSSTDKDYYRITTTNAAPKLKVTLSNLPLDYDVKLYNSNGSLLATSALGGTSTETIKYNAATTGKTYYIYVYGYNGAFSTANCYALNASTSASNWKVSEEFSEEKAEINLYPNPAGDKMSVTYFAELNDNVSFNVYNTMGQKVISKSEHAINEGENTSSFEFNTLSNGIYIMEMIHQDERKVQRFVIQK